MMTTTKSVVTPFQLHLHFPDPKIRLPSVPLSQEKFRPLQICLKWILLCIFVFFPIGDDGVFDNPECVYFVCYGLYLVFGIGYLGVCIWYLRVFIAGVLYLTPPGHPSTPSNSKPTYGTTVLHPYIRSYLFQCRQYWTYIKS